VNPFKPCEKPVPALAEGDRVRCYTDPIKCEKVEGVVTVLEVLTVSGMLELCRVRFDDTFEAFAENECNRWLSVANKIPAPIVS
jgi:hypothetical protein